MNKAEDQLQPGTPGYTPVATGDQPTPQQQTNNIQPDDSPQTEDSQEEIKEVNPAQLVDFILEGADYMKQSLKRLATVEGYEAVSELHKHISQLTGSVETIHHNAKRKSE